MNIRHLFGFTVSLLSFFLGNSIAEALEKPPLFLQRGEQRVLKLPEFDRYSVSGSAIRYTRISQGNQLLIKGIQPGMSTLILTHRHQASTQIIHVEAKLQSPYPHPLWRALALLETTEAIDGGNQFILRGLVGNNREAKAIAFLKKRFAPFILDETSLEPHWLQNTSQQIISVLKPYPHLKLLSREDALCIQGVIVDQAALNGIVRKIQEIQPLAEFDIQTMKGFSPTLYFKVFLLEVKKEHLSKIGTEIAQPFSGSSINSILHQPLQYSIHALSEKGFVRILSAPELVVKSPGQAELFAGGEMPIRLKSKFQDQVSWKNVGLSLKLDVKEYNGESVRLSIETELNHLNRSLDSNDLPGIGTNRIKTQVQGTIGKPLLLSGLLQEDTRHRVRGLPGLSEIPVLGTLFGSEDFQRNRSELVAVLLPYREPPRDPLQRISSDIPKGYLPLPRNHLSSMEVENLQTDRSYPWNAL